MNNIIIGISGKQLSGKDTVANILIKQFGLQGFEFKRIGLADALKQEYSEEKGITLEEIEKNKHIYRQDLIQLGQKRRNENSNYWIDKVINQEQFLIIPDVRFLNEKQAVELNGGIVIRVESDIKERENRGKLSCIHDKSERMLDELDLFDFIVENNSTIDALIEPVKVFVELVKIYNIYNKNSSRSLFEFYNDLFITLQKLNIGIKGIRKYYGIEGKK